MMDEKELAGMRKELSELAESKIRQSNLSRELVRKSKELIYSVHRGDMEAAEKHAAEIKEKRGELDGIASDERLRRHGSYGVAVQEYVEALTYYGLMTDKKLPTREDLRADTESYLMGLSDLTGELVRKAVDDMINERYERAVWIKDTVSDIYGGILSLDLEGGEARRKTDQIKYNLNKLEDLVYDAKIRGKI